MAKRNKGIKIMAVLALFGIIIGILGTGLLIIFSKNNTSEQTLSEEQYIELQKMINAQSGITIKNEVNSLTGETIKNEIETLSGKTK